MENNKKNASERIQVLENGMMSLYQTLENMTRDLLTIREAVKLLGNKLDAVVKASSSGQALNDEVIASIMVQNNVNELKEKVDSYIEQGILKATDVAEEDTFVVGKEISEDGTVQNPRMQFIVSSLSEEIKNKFPGHKVGDVLDLKEGKWKFEITELYSVGAPSMEAPLENSESAPN